MKFVESCVADSLPIWEACLETEFLKKMADGSLSEDCFKGYIVDDSLYLREYAKVFAWGILGAEDMEEIRYRCLISSLQAVEVAGNKWGVSFQVTCDSPYAYLRPMVYDYMVASSLTTTLRSESSHNGFYYPKLAITGHTGGDLSIWIENRMETSSFTFQGLPSAMGDLTIDCENGVITSASGLNPYQYLSYDTPFHFPRFARGDNTITMTGSGRYTFTCEWPVNVGG